GDFFAVLGVPPLMGRGLTASDDREGAERVPPGAVVAMTDVVAVAQRGARFGAGMLATLACLGLLLAALGLYVVMAQAALQRTREIGVRVALGAQPRDVAALVARYGLVPAGLGLVVGLVSVLALGRFLSGVLYEIRPLDPASYAGVAGLLVA